MDYTPSLMKNTGKFIKINQGENHLKCYTH